MPLDHVALTVRDRERSAAFYGEHLGFTARVHDDDHLLILATARAPPRPEGGRAAAGPAPHEPLRWAPARGRRRGRARERLRVAGVLETQWQEEGPTRVQVRDPDGYRVELYAF